MGLHVPDPRETANRPENGYGLYGLYASRERAERAIRQLDPGGRFAWKVRPRADDEYRWELLVDWTPREGRCAICGERHREEEPCEGGTH